MWSRREFVASAAGAAYAPAASAGLIVETHVHLFGSDSTRFPRHPNGPPLRPAPLEEYEKFAAAVGIAHAVHVSAEPYQDDLRYLSYTLENARPGFLKGTLLFDSIGEDTPRRMEAMVRRHGRQIVALRIHCTRGRSAAPTTSGALRDRDLLHPSARPVWKKAGELGLAIQLHIQPWFAPQVEQLAREFPDTPVWIDHFGHSGADKAEFGYRDPREFDLVLRLAQMRQVILKVSSLQYSSRQPAPHDDVRPLARRALEAFGPDRMMWGSLGHSAAEFRQQEAVFQNLFGFLQQPDRDRIRGLTAKRVMGF